jgi:hypothetical protein
MEQAGAVEQPQRQAAVRRQSCDEPYRTALLIDPFHLDGLVARHLERLRIGRQQQTHIDAEPGEGERQGGTDIGQAAGLGEGIDFGRSEQHAHRETLSAFGAAAGIGERVRARRASSRRLSKRRPVPPSARAARRERNGALSL